MNTELPTQIPAAPVDGPALMCPLCNYDLRGLTEPRCPECGYQFVWAELLDTKRNTHPYLFEHHPRNNFWSFVRTVIGGFNPFFWDVLRPQMKPNAGRMLAYWAICSIGPMLLAAAMMIGGAVAEFIYLDVNPNGSFIIGNGQGGISRFPGVPPPPVTPPALAQTIYNAYPAAKSVLLACVVICIWAAITYLTLLIFQQSMANAKILPIHVVRCAVYSFDVAIWVGLVGIICFGLSFVASFDSSLVFIFALLVLLPLAALRLWLAYGMYLAMEHAGWVGAVIAVHHNAGDVDDRVQH